jgi:hypothetical protein
MIGMPSTTTLPALDCSIEARKQRWRAFLAPDAGPGFMFLIRHQDPEDALPEKPPLWPSCRDRRVEYIWAKYRQAMERAEWLHDDNIPNFDMLTGTEIYAEALGCEVFRPEGTNPHAMPLIQTAGQVAGVKVPELSRSSLAYLFEMADELQRRAGREAVFRFVDGQTPMAVAALVWRKEDFLPALLEEPEAVRELAAKARELLFPFYDEWLRRYGTAHVSHYPDYFMPEGITVSEDEVGAVSGEIFETFFLPDLAALSSRYGGLGVHCCADSRHQWKHFKRIPGLRLLNLNRPPTRGPEFVRDALRYFADHCAQWMFGWAPDGTIAERVSAYPKNARVVIEYHTKSREDAVAAAEKFNELRAEGAF